MNISEYNTMNVIGSFAEIKGEFETAWKYQTDLNMLTQLITKACVIIERSEILCDSCPTVDKIQVCYKFTV